MKITTHFKKLVAKNRRVLIKQYGFMPNTVSMWEHGNRIPKYETAIKLAEIFGVDVDTIPYYRTIINK